MHVNDQQALIALEGRATYERILAAVCEEEPEEATRQIQNFLRVYPEFAQAHNDLAVIFYRAGNTLKALAHYERAHKLEPRNVTFRKNLADFYAVELEWNDEASHIYLDILKDNPFDVETLNALGTLAGQGGRKEQARQFFTRALQLDPLSTNARQALQLISGDPTSIQQLPENSIPSPSETPAENIRQPIPPLELPPSPAQLHEQATQAANSGRTGEAISLLEKLVSVHPAYAVAHNDLGVLLYIEGDTEGARRAYERAVGLQPSNANFRKNLADLYFVALGRTDDAIRIYLDIFREQPRDMETLAGLGHICAAVNRPEEAKTFYRRALEVEPWNVEIRNAIQQMI